MRSAPIVALVLVAAAVVAACGGSEGSASSTTLALTGAAAAGRREVQDLGCMTCHTVDGSDGVGPTWKGLAGSKVQLADGKEVTADAAYLRRAIVDPGAQVVDGFRSIMPERDLTDEQVDSIVAYLQALGR
jgi:cytochrome c oxidase subunit II